MTLTVVHDHFPLLVALLHGRNIDDLQNGRHVHLMAQIRYGIEQGHVGASEPRIGNLSVVRHLALTHGENPTPATFIERPAKDERITSVYASG